MAWTSINDNLPPPPPPEGVPPPNQPRCQLKVNESFDSRLIYFHYDPEQNDILISNFPTLEEHYSVEGGLLESDTANIRAYKLTTPCSQRQDKKPQIEPDVPLFTGNLCRTPPPPICKP